MQEAQVGWDPISINHQLPWEEKVFVLYLVLALAFALLRSAKLAWKLWSFSAEKESARRNVDSFWEESAAKNATMKNLAALTLILSGLILSYELMSDFRWIQVEKVWGIAAITGMLAEGLQMLVLGLGVSAVVYALSSLIECALARRRAEWNLFVANVSDRREVE